MKAVAPKHLVGVRELTRLAKYVRKHFISRISVGVKTAIKTKHWHKHMGKIYKAKILQEIK